METPLLQQVKFFLTRHFDLRQEKEDDEETIESLKKGVEFRGTNLWVLIFAIFLASLGLNTNSTAVIIGAMLISPLMGPIMGFGLGLGIADFDLVKRSLRNYLTATLFSVVTATIYFLISPISEAQSELLARTSPTIYDVLIAFFGGLAGIVAGSTKSKGNVMPTRRGHRHRPHAAPLHRRIRLGDGQLELLPRRLLPLFYQYGLHQPLHLHRGAGAEVSA